jgi:hypothetical protein
MNVSIDPSCNTLRPVRSVLSRAASLGGITVRPVSVRVGRSTRVTRRSYIATMEIGHSLRISDLCDTSVAAVESWMDLHGHLLPATAGEGSND